MENKRIFQPLILSMCTNVQFLQYTLYLYVVGFPFKDLANKVNTVLILCVISSPERGEIS